MGRPASSSVGSPYSRPAITGKPGIMLAPPCFGFSRSPLPALCRQATSCAWRSRLRKILACRSECSRGRAKVRSGWHPWGRVAPQTVARPNRSGVSWASLGGCVARVVEDAVQEAHRNRATTLAKRYAQCGLADKCAQKHTNR